MTPVRAPENNPRETAQDPTPTKPVAPVSESDGDGRKRSASPAEDAAAVNDGAGALTLAGGAPLPDGDPPLPDEAPPQDDGWDYKWDDYAKAFYFYNRFTGKSQWENPRLPQAAAATTGPYDSHISSAAGLVTSSGAPGTSSPPTLKRKRLHGGYNPAIHGNYDPKADYARESDSDEEEEAPAAGAGASGLPKPGDNDYSTHAPFNRFTGKFQPGMNPEYHNDENKSKRQMNAFFDVDAAANSHDGRSLKEERRNKKLSKKELKAFKQKAAEKKREKARNWLTRD